MTPLKRVERLAKRILARVVAWLYPRKRSTLNRLPTKFLLVRIDSRVGEALLNTPLFDEIKEQFPKSHLAVLVNARVANTLAGHPAIDQLIPFGHRLRWLGPWAPEIVALRKEAFDCVIDCSNWTDPSVTSAIVSRLISAEGKLIGPSTLPIGPLHDIAIEPLPGILSEVAQRLHLLSPLHTRADPEVLWRPLSFRPPVVSERLQSFLGSIPSPRAILYPGGRLAWRRAPVTAFQAAGNSLVKNGYQVVVAWGPGEEGLVRELTAFKLAPPTTLDELAGLFSRAELVISNNTGPMHLAVAVGTPTLGVFLKMDPERWGHNRAPHQTVDLGRGKDDGAQAKALEQATENFIRATRAWREATTVGQ